MTHCECYLKSFGELTEEQKDIVKKTLNYSRCALADEWVKLRKEILRSFKGLVRRKKSGKF